MSESAPRQRRDYNDEPTASGLVEAEATIERLRLENAQLRLVDAERRREHFYIRALIDELPDYLYVKDTESRFVVVNKAVAVDTGRASPDDLVGKNDFDMHPQEVAQRFFAIEQEIIRSGRPMGDMEQIVADASGAEKWLSTTKVPLRDESNEIVGLVGIGRDVTERKHAETLRTGQAQVLEMIAMNAPLEDILVSLVRLVESQLDRISASVLLLDEGGKHLRHGAAPNLPEAYVKAIDGVRIGPKVGSCGTAVYRRETVIVSDILRDPLWEDYRELAVSHGFRSCWSTPILSHQDAVLGTFAMYSNGVREPNSVETSLIDLATRIAGIAIERKQAEDRIHFMAHHDALTGLPNRILLNDRLSQAMLNAQRHDSWVTVVFIDLDNFKLINDGLGHSAGDELLKIVADRMVACIRSTDTVVRLGGDEFVILLCDQPKSLGPVTLTLQKIRAAIAEPIHIDEQLLYVTSSIGLAIYPTDGKDSKTLLINADAAMYNAKDAGRDNFQFYKAEMDTKVHERLSLQEQLRTAIVRSESCCSINRRSTCGPGASSPWKHSSAGSTPISVLFPRQGSSR